MKNGIVIGTIACVVAIILIGSALAPIINITTTTTTTIDNEGAIGLRMDRVSSGDFTINYGMVGDDFTATNGTDTQVIDDLCIFYADNNVAVWMDDSSVIMLGKDADNNTIDEKLSDESTITITKSSAGLEITDGTITQTFPVPTWAYIPKSTGSYGFFLNETEINTGGLPVQYVGSFAGVNCYNSINTYDLPITIDAALTDSELSGAKWIKQATETAPEELNPDDLHIIPLDPSIIDPTPEPDASIMAYNPPTPTYTDGDWGYNLKTIDGVQKAIIVSYSGTGGNIVTPATVGGYDVYQIGLGERAYQLVVNNDNISANSTLTITNGPKIIGQYAFYACTNFTGNLTIPSSVETIGENAFRISGTGGFTTLTLSQGLKSIEEGAFEGSGLTGGLTIPDTVETIGNRAFGSNSFTGDLIIPDSVTSIGDSAFTSFGYNNAPGSALYLSSNLSTINNYTFSSCGFSTIAKWPDNLETIGDNAFYQFNKKLTSLNIPEGVKTIGNRAFYASIGSNSTPATLTLPKSLEVIGQSSFYMNYIDGTLILWDKITDIGSSAFGGSYLLDNLIIMSNPTIGNNAFKTNVQLSEVANLGGADLNSSVQDWGANVVIEDNIPALGYLAPTQYKETVKNDGPASVLLNVIPLITIVGVLLFAVGFTIYRRNY